MPVALNVFMTSLFSTCITKYQILADCLEALVSDAFTMYLWSLSFHSRRRYISGSIVQFLHECLFDLLALCTFAPNSPPYVENSLTKHEPCGVAMVKSLITWPTWCFCVRTLTPTAHGIGRCLVSIFITDLSHKEARKKIMNWPSLLTLPLSQLFCNDYERH